MSSLIRKTSAGIAATGSLVSLNTTVGFTISFWHKCLSGANNQSHDIFRQTLSTNAARSGYQVQLSSAGQLLVNICTATASVQTQATGNNRTMRQQWMHYAATYNASTAIIVGYVNGVNNRTRTAAGAIVAAATPTTTVLGTELLGQQADQCIFDLQLHVGTVVGNADIATLMRPDRTRPSLTARWFGLQFGPLASGQVLRDESGKGNNLTTSTALDTGPEPPWRPTLG